MTTLKKLSSAQLVKVIDDTKTELARRKNIGKATAEIRSILRKYKVDFKDIDSKLLAKTLQVKSDKNLAKVKKSCDQRSTVKAKYKDPESPATWTGRGRAPAWVKDICLKEGVDIEEFKKNERFSISSNYKQA